MTSINPTVGVLLYCNRDVSGPSLLFQREQNGSYAPPSSQWNEHRTSHLSETAATVLGQENYSNLLQTIQQYKNGVAKIDDTRHRQVIYLARTQEGKIAIPDDCEWIPIKEVMKAFEDASPRYTFSQAFLKTAPLLLGTDEDENLLKRIKEDGSVCGLVRGNPKNESTITCDLRDNGNDPSKETIDEEFLPQIDWEKNQFTIEGQTYQITSKHRGKVVPLGNLDPAFKRHLLATLREAVHHAAPQNKLAAVEKIVFEFQEMSLNQARFYGEDPDNPMHVVEGADQALAPFKDSLNKIQEKLCVQRSKQIAQHAEDAPVRGIPRQFQTCWLGTSMHLISHLYGHHLETIAEDEAFMDNYDENGQELLRQLLNVKRKLFKEVNGPITIEEVNRIIDLSAGLTPDNNWDPNVPHDPAEYVSLINQYFGFSDVNGLIELAPPAVPARNTPQESVNLIDFANHRLAIGPLPAELHFHIDRNDYAGGKNTQHVGVQTEMTLENGDIYELVGASVHHGDSVNGGHYITLSKKCDHFWRCNDQHIEKEDNQAALQTDLQTNATSLVYRRIAPFNEDHEKVLKALHSHSRLDTDKWLHRNIVVDYAQQLVTTANAGSGANDVELLQQPDGSAVKIGQDSNLAELVNSINTSPANRLVIPVLKNDRHWVLLMIDKTSGTIEYFDSVGRQPGPDVTAFAGLLGYQLVQVLDQESKWQQDGWRCGLYTLQYLQLRLAEGHSLEDIQCFEEYRCHTKDAITAFRGKLQNKYNRYQPNYGFIAQP